MDVRKLVRDAVPTQELSQERIAAARRRLTENSLSPRPERSRARKAALWSAGMLVAAAAVVVGVLIVDSLAPGGAPEALVTDPPARTASPMPPPTATPERETPKQVFAGAAAAVNRASAPAPQGRYTKVEQSVETLVVDGEEGISSPGSEYRAPSDGDTSGWVQRQLVTTYVPVDLRKDWYEQYGPAQLVETYGDKARAEEAFRGWEQQVRSWDDGSDQLRAVSPPTAPIGLDSWKVTLADFFDRMPRDPDELISWIRAQLDESPTWQDGQIALVLVDLLAYNAGPADLRAAMFQALGLLPGSEVSKAEGRFRTVTFSADFLNRADTSKSYFWVLTVSIDMETGLLSEKTMSMNDGSGIVPIEVPNTRVTYRISQGEQPPVP